MVNNAFSSIAKGADASLDDWHRMYEVGPIAHARLASLPAHAMRKTGGGAIVNVFSVSAFIAQPGRWTYNTAEGAVHTLTKCRGVGLRKVDNSRQQREPWLDMDTGSAQSYRRRTRKMGSGLGTIP
ncbi:MAG: SDR family NAD(P)-dependent oxidoreductase [Acidobacteriaceae bacterium]